jgi:hypothetical protein
MIGTAGRGNLTVSYPRVRGPALDMSTLTEGDAEFDYFVRVPVSRTHDISQRISDLQFEVDCRFGVTITGMPIPGAD